MYSAKTRYSNDLAVLLTSAPESYKPRFDKLVRPFASLVNVLLLYKNWYVACCLAF